MIVSRASNKILSHGHQYKERLNFAKMMMGMSVKITEDLYYIVIEKFSSWEVVAQCHLPYPPEINDIEDW